VLVARAGHRRLDGGRPARPSGRRSVVRAAARDGGRLDDFLTSRNSPVSPFPKRENMAGLRSMKRVYNFSPGPATLPVSVLEEASRGVLEIGGSGMSILEVSHRGKEYEAIHFDARDRMLRALGLDAAEYGVMFLGGGASLQFAMLPMNLLGGGTADYVNTGEWAVKAIKEAKRFGTVNVAGTSEDKKFSYIPKSLKLTAGAKYVHITTNNTIEGTEWAALPDSGDVPLIADASSDILGRAFDFKKLSLLYAGAQKNLGPAGVTVVVARRKLIEAASDETAAILSYKTHLKNDSLYNTPP